MVPFGGESSGHGRHETSPLHQVLPFRGRPESQASLPFGANENFYSGHQFDWNQQAPSTLNVWSQRAFQNTTALNSQGVDNTIAQDSFIDSNPRGFIQGHEYIVSSTYQSLGHVHPAINSSTADQATAQPPADPTLYSTATSLPIYPATIPIDDPTTYGSSSFQPNLAVAEQEDWVSREFDDLIAMQNRHPWASWPRWAPDVEQQQVQDQNTLSGAVPINTPRPYRVLPSHITVASSSSVPQHGHPAVASPSSPYPSPGSQLGPSSPTGSVHGALPKVAIPHKDSQAALEQRRAMNGPLSSNIVIPPRPRPGRKPIAVDEETKGDRRRLQNRVAQRNFRDKRQLKLQETQQKLNEVQSEKDVQIGGLHTQVAALTRKLNDVTAERDQLRAQVAQLQTDLNARDANAPSRDSIVGLSSTPLNFPHRHARHRSSAQIPTPTEEVETDFTSLFKSTGTGADQMDVDDRCGFCTDDSNCACKASTLKGPSSDCGFCTDSGNCICKETEKSSLAVPTQPSPQPESQSQTGPGNCDLCRTDPQRAQACRDLAALSNFGTFRPSTYYEPAPSDRISTLPPSSSMLPSMSPDSIMTCSSFIDKLGDPPQRLASIKELFGTQLQGFPVPGVKGYSIETAEAAEALQTLSKRKVRTGEDDSAEDQSR